MSKTTTVDNGNCSIGRLALEQHGGSGYFQEDCWCSPLYFRKKKEQSVKAMIQRRSAFPFKLGQKSHFISYQLIATLFNLTLLMISLP